MYGSGLPLTGAGVAIGGVYFDQMGIVAIALGFIVAGAILVRFSFRRGRRVTEV